MTTEKLKATVFWDGSSTGTSAEINIFDTSYEKVVQIDKGAITSYGKQHINLWDYFIYLYGRQPYNGETINFVFDNVVLLGTMAASFPSFTNAVGVAYPAKSYSGYPALTTEGWATNNTLSVSLINNTSVIGSPAALPTRYIGSGMGTGLDPNDVSILISRNQYTVSVPSLGLRPAVQATVPLKITVDPGSAIYGGGGNNLTYADVIGAEVPASNNTYAPILRNGGDAILASGATVTLINNGVVSGGGGAGGGYGLSYLAGLLNNAWAQGTAGGGGAPYGGGTFYSGYNGNNELIVYGASTTDSQGSQSSTTDANGITTAAVVPANLVKGGIGAIASSPNHGNWRGGNGGAPGSSGTNSTHTGINAVAGYVETGASAGTSLVRVNGGVINVSGGGSVR